MKKKSAKEVEARKTSEENDYSIVVSDIESQDWDKFLCIGYYDGDLFWWWDNLAEYFQFIFSIHEIKKIYFHFGGIFDFLFLLSYAFENSDKYKVVSMIPRGSSFLCITIKSMTPYWCHKARKYKYHEIKFMDSSGLLKFGLATLSKNFNVENPKGEWDHTKTNGVTDELIEYLYYDHLSLYEVLQKYSNHPMIACVGLKMTSTSQAYNLFTQYYLKEKISPLKKDVEVFCRNAYTGGRTEVFIPVHFKQKGKKIKSFDVTSLYPYVMHECDMPVRYNGETSHLDLDVMSIAHVKVKVPMMKIPPLGIKTKQGFVFPVGTFSGYWTNVELKMAIKYGVEILEVYRVMTFNNGGPIFRDYIADMFERRKKSDKKSADNIIYKQMMNELYGRYGLDVDNKEQIIIDEGKAVGKPFVDVPISDGRVVSLMKQEVKLRTKTFLPIPIFVTSYARVNNYEKYLKPYENEIFYTDTDSFKTLRDLPIGNELGELKFEYEMDEACYLVPKTYLESSTDKKIVKMKGMRKVDHFNFDDFFNALEGELRMKDSNIEAEYKYIKGRKIPEHRMHTITEKRLAKFKESLRRNKKVLSVLEESVKSITGIYNKRQIIKKGKFHYDTVPLIIEE